MVQSDQQQIWDWDPGQETPSDRGGGERALEPGRSGYE